MFLFRSSNNNQHYASVSLIDSSDNKDDEVDEEKDGKLIKD